jgi:hypothetical protein
MLGITYITKDFQKIQNKIRVDRQISKLSNFQEIAKTEILIEKENKELEELCKIIREKKNYIIDLQHTLSFPNTTVKKNYIRPCSVADCRGFLNSNYNCELCNTTTCSDCLEIKKSDHVCDENTKATASLIKKDTKNCPKCGMGIFKIDGCFGENTEIPMWDGTVKKIQDIVIGDILIGDDGNPREVLNTFNGEDNLYEVKQENGINYVVNSKHELVLKYTGNNIIKKISDNNYTINTLNVEKLKRKTYYYKTYQDAKNKKNELKDYYKIKVEDYINIEGTIKKELCGFKSNNSINWENKNVSLDPYLLGLWIGDGNKKCAGFAVNSDKDIEILEYLYEWCEKNDCELIHSNAYYYYIRRKIINNKNAIGHGNNSVKCKGCIDLLKISPNLKSTICDIKNTPYINNNLKREKVNKFISNLKKYNLINNKHIPSDYIINSEEVRLNVLAGIIDSDGWVGNYGKRIVIVQTNLNIVKNIEYLARSLGFYTNITSKERKNEIIFNNLPKNYQTLYKINISGENINKIPTKLYRKKCNVSNYNKDVYKTKITVEPIGKGKYYGFELDKNHLFVLTDMTVQKNCDQIWCSLCQTAFSWKTGIIEVGRIHNPHYYEFLRKQNNGEIPREEDVAERLECRNRIINNNTLRHCNSIYKSNTNTKIKNIMLFICDYIRYYYHNIAIKEGFDRNLINIDEKINRLNIEYLKNRIVKDSYEKSIGVYEKKKELITEKNMIMITLTDNINDTILEFYDKIIDIINKKIIIDDYELIFNTNLRLYNLIEYCKEEDIQLSKLYSSKTRLDIDNFPIISKYIEKQE